MKKSIFEKVELVNLRKLIGKHQAERNELANLLNIFTDEFLAIILPNRELESA